MPTELTYEQRTILKELLNWSGSAGKNSSITLGGYAGTGKTTLLSILRKILNKYFPDKKVAFCSYTGKAAQVLRYKLKEENALSLNDSVSTIHSLIYSPLVNSQQEIIGWSLKDELPFDLIIIDEASMVDEKLWNDLKSFETPIIAVGDHGQLPPIEGSFNLMQEPNLRLEEIHRQSKDNPIIKLSVAARTEGIIKVGEYGKNVAKYDSSDQLSYDVLEGVLEDISRNTLVLVGYNQTRVNLNSYIRTKKFFESPHPQRRDRVICLRNNHRVGIFNGMLGTVIDIFDHDEHWYSAKIEMDEGIKYEGLIYAPQFNSKESLNFTGKRKNTVKGDLFDFGYGLTVHKAQGSEADKVILFEERNRHMNEEQWRRWLYTGITRAKKELLIFGKPEETE